MHRRNGKAPEAAPVLLTVEEAARRLALGVKTTRALIRGGSLRAVRIGRTVRVPASEVHACVQRLLVGLL